VVAAAVGVLTGVLACAAVVGVALTAAVIIVAITSTTAATTVVIVVVIIIVIVVIIAIIAIAITAVVVAMVVVIVITIIIMIVIMVVVMITVVVVRTSRLVVRRTVAIIVVVVGVAVVIVVMVRRMTLYPIRSGVIYVYGRVPKVVGRPRLVPNYCVIMRTHIERTPQYRCRCHCNHRGCRRSNVHIVVIGGNCYPRTMEPLDSHLVRIVDVIFDVINVAAVNLRVGGYCGNHRHYYE